MYLGMNKDSGLTINDKAHIEQSIRDILVTPLGSRVMRRNYGSLLFRLIDAPANDETILKLYSAIYSALLQYEPRIKINSINLNINAEGEMVIDLNAIRCDTGGSDVFQVGI